MPRFMLMTRAHRPGEGMSTCPQSIADKIGAEVISMLSEAVVPVDKRKVVSLATSFAACLELQARTRILIARGIRDVDMVYSG
jgi:hypothetical protein